MQPVMPLLACAVLAGCQALPEAPAGACGAASLQGLVGQRLDRTNLSDDRPIRVIEPGMLITMDHRAERLNIRLDETGTVVSVDCG